MVLIVVQRVVSVLHLLFVVLLLYLDLWDLYPLRVLLLKTMDRGQGTQVTSGKYRDLHFTPSYPFFQLDIPRLFFRWEFNDNGREESGGLISGDSFTKLSSCKVKVGRDGKDSCRRKSDKWKYKSEGTNCVE